MEEQNCPLTHQLCSERSGSAGVEEHMCPPVTSPLGLRVPYFLHQHAPMQPLSVSPMAFKNSGRPSWSLNSSSLVNDACSCRRGGAILSTRTGPMAHLARQSVLTKLQPRRGGVEEKGKEIWGQSSVCGLGHGTTPPFFCIFKLGVTVPFSLRLCGQELSCGAWRALLSVGGREAIQHIEFPFVYFPILSFLKDPQTQGLCIDASSYEFPMISGDGRLLPCQHS